MKKINQTLDEKLTEKQEEICDLKDSLKTKVRKIGTLKSRKKELKRELKLNKSKLEEMDFKENEINTENIQENPNRDDYIKLKKELEEKYENRKSRAKKKIKKVEKMYKKGLEEKSLKMKVLEKKFKDLEDVVTGLKLDLMKTREK